MKIERRPLIVFAKWCGNILTVALIIAILFFRGEILDWYAGNVPGAKQTSEQKSQSKKIHPGRVINDGIDFLAKPWFASWIGKSEKSVEKPPANANQVSKDSGGKGDKKNQAMSQKINNDQRAGVPKPISELDKTLSDYARVLAPKGGGKAEPDPAKTKRVSIQNLIASPFDKNKEYITDPSFFGGTKKSDPDKWMERRNP
jgi:hypothetical protein